MPDDANLERILTIAKNGITSSMEEEDQEELRLDTFAIVSVWAWEDEDGQECEGYSVWSESRRSHVQVGILVGGLARIAEGGGKS